MTTKIIGIREFRNNMAYLCRDAKKKRLRYIVSSRNKPLFEVTPLNEREVVLEELAKDVKEARKDVLTKRLYSAEEIREALGL